jgi:hydrogenase/urease accessory protein HupE
MTKRVAAIGLAWLALASPAAAHPGHGSAGGDWSALHYLSEPEHLLFAVPFLVLVAVLGARVLRSRRRDRA